MENEFFKVTSATIFTQTNLKTEHTMIIVALGSLGISISFPTGPVIFTSAPGFKSPAYST